MKHGIISLCLALLLGCASAPTIQDTLPEDGYVQPAWGPATEATAAVLGAELAARRGAVFQAASLYFDAAVLTRDPGLAERATRLAFSASRTDLALRAATLWQELVPEDRNAQGLKLRAGVAEGAVRVDDLEAWLVQAPDSKEAEQQIAALLAAASPDAEQVLQMLEQLEERRDSASLAYATALLALRYDKPDRALTALSRARDRGYSAIACDELTLRVQLAAAKDMAAAETVARIQQSADLDRPLALSVGQLLLDDEAWQLAEAHFRFVINRWPEADSARLALGLLAAQAGDDAEAKRNLEQLWERGARQDEAAWQLGRIASRAQQWAEAEQWFARVGEGSRQFDAQLGLVQAIARQGRMLEAQSRLSSLRSDQPDQAVRLWQAEAELLQSAGQLGDALRVLSAGIAETQSLDLYYTRGLYHELGGNLAGAQADLEHIIAVDAENAQALNALGYMLADHGLQLDRARALIEKALAMRPDDPAIRDSLGWVLFRSGAVVDARRWLSEAFSDYPDPEIGAHLGEVLWTLGEYEDARRIWGQASERDPGNSTLLETMQRLLR